MTKFESSRVGPPSVASVATPRTEQAPKTSAGDLGDTASPDESASRARSLAEPDLPPEELKEGLLAAQRPTSGLSAEGVGRSARPRTESRGVRQKNLDNLSETGVRLSEEQRRAMRSAVDVARRGAELLARFEPNQGGKVNDTLG